MITPENRLTPRIPAGVTRRPRPADPATEQQPPERGAAEYAGDAEAPPRRTRSPWRRGRGRRTRREREDGQRVGQRDAEGRRICRQQAAAARRRRGRRGGPGRCAHRGRAGRDRASRRSQSCCCVSAAATKARPNPATAPYSASAVAAGPVASPAARPSLSVRRMRQARRWAPPARQSRIQSPLPSTTSLRPCYRPPHRESGRGVCEYAPAAIIYQFAAGIQRAIATSRSPASVRAVRSCS